MPLRPQTQSSLQHWSKDYVEHLRTVHFALVALSTGLIVLLLSVQYDASSAAAQLARVNDILTLWSHIDENPDVEDPDTIVLDTNMQGRSMEYSKWVHRVLAVTALYEKTPSPPTTYRVHMTGVNLFECSVGFYTQLNPSFAPKTIQTFADWWNALNSSPMVIDRISHLGSLEDGKESDSGMQADLSLSGANCSLDDIRALPALLSSFTEEDQFHFRLLAIVRSKVNQRYVVAHFGGDVGEFATAFPDLAKAARNREDKDLLTLTSQISAEASKGGDVFEAFGIKFPSEQVTRWGMIVLVVLQLYFLMYLQRLSNKLKSEDPAWELPWMAMDQSWLARVMLLASVLCLPICAASLVVIRTMQKTAGENVRTVLASINLTLLRHNVCILAAFVVSVTLSVLCWKYRPKLTEPVAAPEVLEDQGSGI